MSKVDIFRWLADRYKDLRNGDISNPNRTQKTVAIIGLVGKSLCDSFSSLSDDNKDKVRDNLGVARNPGRAGYTKEAFIKLAAQPPAYTRTRPQGVKLRHMPSVGMMYDAYKYAETGSMLKPGDPDWWKRTTDSTYPGSSAFGPVQVTENTMDKVFLYHPTFKSRYGAWYEQNMRPMQKNFLKHGLNSNKPWYDKRYDYGGDGYWDHKNNAMYTNMSKDIMRLKMLDADKALNKLPADQRTPHARVLNHIQTWRGKPMNHDQAYYDKVMDNIYSKHPELFDNYDESKIDPRIMQKRQQRLKQMQDSWVFK